MTRNRVTVTTQVVEVTHPGRGPVPKTELAEVLSQNYNVKDPKTVFLYGFRTHVSP